MKKPDSNKSRSTQSFKSGTKPAQPIKVVVGQPKDGQAQAQIKIGPTAQANLSLSEFSEEVQSALKDAPPKTELPCLPTQNPTPQTVLPAGPPIFPQVAAPFPPLPVAGPPQPAVPTARLMGFHGDRALFDNALFEGGERVHLEKLGLADPATGARVGALFIRKGTTKQLQLHTYAPDVQPGVSARPHVNINPYNFAAWQGTQPWNAEEPEKATHAGPQEGRHSGIVEVAFTAKTPIFIASTADSSQFFRCWDWETKEERLALPGSSVKGAVRSLFEALTNSRCGVSDRDSLQHPPLYRRRSSQLYVVLELPTEQKEGRLLECDFVYCSQNAAGAWSRTDDDACGIIPAITPAEVASGPTTWPLKCIEMLEWRANLYWVDSLNHHHCRHPCPRKTHIAYRSRGRVISFPYQVLLDYVSMQNNPHFIEHVKNLKQPPYSATFSLTYNDCRQDLFRVNKWELLFGIPIPDGKLACFGKNVNFLWPGQAPAGLADKFLARPEEEMKREGADMAELTFGFAGKSRESSHPFRSRVRFSIFWAASGTLALPEVTLKPLLSPPGTKCKSRPLYLKKRQNGETADYSDPSASLKGRKFYWHQHAEEGIPSQHLAATAAHGAAQATDPVRLSPLPRDSTFAGQVQFTNLTSVELGALLVSLNPELAFGSGFGIKIGKGKPRGLGSVTAKLELKFLEPTRYKALSSPVLQAATETNVYIDKYKNWAGQQAHSTWDNLEFVRDLRRLLAIPSCRTVKLYPTSFHQFGWTPEWGKANGDPPSAKERSPVMQQARDL